MVGDGPDAVGYFSHAVEADGWLFFAGQIASGTTGEPLPDGIEAQTRKTLDNVMSVLKGCDCGVENVVSVRIFLTTWKPTGRRSTRSIRNIFRRRTSRRGPQSA